MDNYHKFVNYSLENDHDKSNSGNQRNILNPSKKTVIIPDTIKIVQSRLSKMLWKLLIAGRESLGRCSWSRSPWIQLHRRLAARRRKSRWRIGWLFEAGRSTIVSKLLGNHTLLELWVWGVEIQWREWSILQMRLWWNVNEWQINI